MKKSYFFGIMFLLYATYGLGQNCAAGYTLSSTATSICSGNTITLTLSGSETGVGYELSDGTSVINTIIGNNSSISFTVNPTISTTYTVTAAGCASPYDSITINIISPPNIALSSANDTQTRCQNVAIANITYNVTNATGASVSGLPTGVNGSYSAGVFTISGTPTAAGTFPFTVTTSGGCSPADTATGTITVTALPNVALSSANNTQTRCQNVAIANITYNVTNATGASVSGLPTGVNGSYSAGVFTISGTPTAVGTFPFTVTTSGGCSPADTATGTITVTALPNIALSSANNTQTRCQNVAIANITYNVTNGTGASVSGLPTGVNGSYSAGVFTISGTPTASGTFPFTVTTSGGCSPADTATGTITVTALPNVALSSANNIQTRCQNVAIANITYNVTNATGASVSGLPTGVNGSYSAGVFTISGTPTAAGTFPFTVTTSGGCSPADTATGTITVTALPNVALSSANNIQTRCQNVAIANITYNVTNGTGASVSGLPTGVNGSYSAGVFTISGTPTVAGTFPFTVTTSGGCSPADTATGTITVTALPNVALSSANNIQTRCQNVAIANITYNVTNATGASVSGLPTGVNGSYSAGVFTISGTPTVAGTFPFTVTTSGGCSPADTATGTITVTLFPTATINYTGTPFCKSTATAQSVTLSGTGAYTGGTFTASPAGLTINSGTGAITPNTSTAGTYIITYTIPASGGCAAVPVTTSVTITAVPTATISYSGTPFCKSLGAAQSVTLNGSGAYTGGSYTASPAGLTINASTGDITPSSSTAATYTITYTIPASGGCAAVPVTTNVTITAVPTATISYAGAPFCRSLGSAQSVTRNGTGAYTGGTYTASPAGLTINSGTGAITPNTSTAGMYTVTYTIPASGGCAAIPVTTSVTITAVPTATISYSGTPFCKSLGSAQSVTLNGTGAYTGGSFSATPAGLTINASTGDITPSSSTAATYTITYTIPASAGCTAVPVTTSVTITAVPTATISYAGAPFCRSLGSAQSVTLNGTGAYTGGTYTASPAGLTINSATGAVTPNTSTAGAYIVTYTIPAGGGCATIPVTTNVTITAVPTATISYVGTPFCKSLVTAQSATLTGTGSYTGGTFTAPGGLSINTATGDITPGSSTAGTYTVTYTIPASSGCAAVPVTTSVTISAVPTATISYTGTPFCKSLGSAQSVTLNGTGAYTGGTYTASPAGLTINSATGTITPNTSTAGAYTVTYTIPAGGGCATIPVNTNVTITPVPTATISYAGTPFCKSLGVSQSATINGTGAYTGGTFNAPAGLSINASTGAITPSTSTAGTYTVTYTIPASAGCAAVPVTTSVTITAAPTASISYSGSPYCTSVTTSQNANLSGTGAYTGGTYSASPAGLSINTSTGAVTPSSSTIGTYTVTYSTPTAGGCSSVNATTTVVIDIDPVGGTVSLSNSSIINSTTECFTASGTLYLSGQVGTIVKWQYSITAGTSWVDIANTTTTHTYTNITQNTIFRAVIQNSGGCAAYSTGCVIFVIPNIKPSPVTAAPTTICAGQSSILSSISAYATSQSLASGGAFNNANPPGWTVDSCTNNCLNAGASNTNPGPWQLSATNGGTYSGTTFTSVGKFAIANGNFNSQLYTPTFNTFGLTSASLTFTHAYNLGTGAIGTVEISANGGPWTVLATYTGSSGAASYTNFISVSINLNAYIGQPNLKIRFNYQGTAGSAWAVDNIGIPDAPPSLNTQWVDATTGVFVSNSSTLTVSPLVTTTYAVTSSLNGCNSFGTDGTAYVTVTVNPRPTSVISQDQTVCLGGTATFSIALTGTAPWSLTYSNGTTSTTVNNIMSSPYTFIIPNVMANATYTVTALSDSKCTSVLGDRTGSAIVTVLNGTAGLWTGALSTDWFDCKNWAGGLPSATIDAVIPTVVPNMPLIDPLSPFAAAYSGIASARDVIINTSASITMNANSNLEIKRDWKNSGSFIPGTGTVTFNGATANQVQLINNGIKLNETFYNLTLNCTSGAKGINLADAFELTVQNNLVLTSGDLRLTGEAQMVQNGFTANPAGGTGVLLRDQQGTKSSYHYNYWSSPVSPDNLNYTVSGVLRDGTNAAASPFGPGLISFGDGYDYSDGPLTSPIKISNRWIYKYTMISTSYWDWQLIGSTGSVKVGEGFTMKGVTGQEPVTNYQNYVFVGKPNSGNINLSIAPNQVYLIGNPYSSALNADEFIMDNIRDNGRATSNVFNGALYFWDHFGGQSHYLGEYIGGYATYNLLGGVVAVSNDPMINNNLASGWKIPRRYIPVAQGFFVRTDLGGEGGVTGLITGGTISFKNSQRAFKTESPLNSVFFKTENAAVGSDIDNRQKIRLGFEGPSGLRRQLLLGTDPHATNLIDIGYDALMLDVHPDDMYWIISNAKFVIQAVNNFNIHQIIPLGVKISNAGITKIKIVELENIPLSTEIYIYDNVTGIFHDIKTNDFSFELPIGEYESRFSLRFSTETLVGNETDISNGIMIFADSHHILNIKNNFTDIRVESAQLFNILGQLIAKWDVADEEQQNIKIPVEHIRSGTYIVKLKTSNGSFSKKVIIR